MSWGTGIMSGEGGKQFFCRTFARGAPNAKAVKALLVAEFELPKPGDVPSLVFQAYRIAEQTVLLLGAYHAK